MGSVFVTQEDRAIRGFAGKKYKVPFYLQFVPGKVIHVVHSEESDRYKSPEHINTIIAKPHITDKVYKRRVTLGEKDRYYPLFRTMNDLPSDGDPVLLCTIGKINYYLGPINTTTNNPTWNDDVNDMPELNLSENGLPSDSNSIKGETQNFNKLNIFKRLIKKRKPELDYGNAIGKTTGDTIFEGRHGNSIRIGSRSDNPYVFISNKRDAESNVESLADGSLLAIISNGTISNHFPGYYNQTERDFSDGSANTGILLTEEAEIVENYQLSSDTLPENIRPIGDIYSHLNGDIDINEGVESIYGYNSNQIFLTSDRIIFDSKLSDIFLSSIKDIHIGSGRHLTLSTGKNLTISSEKTFLGNPKNREDSMESMVLGTTLLELLKETLAIIKNSQGICQGAPIPLADENGTPGSVNAKITQIESKIDKILSTKHFIEPNP